MAQNKDFDLFAAENMTFPCTEQVIFQHFSVCWVLDAFQQGVGTPPPPRIRCPPRSSKTLGTPNSWLQGVWDSHAWHEKTNKIWAQLDRRQPNMGSCFSDACAWTECLHDVVAMAHCTEQKEEKVNV